jgi:membrane-bound lytic murein transglycosylase B
MVRTNESVAFPMTHLKRLSICAGTDNFYAITSYNWGSYYAMAVIELGQAVAREMKKRP